MQKTFKDRLKENMAPLTKRLFELYGERWDFYQSLVKLETLMKKAWNEREQSLKVSDCAFESEILGTDEKNLKKDTEDGYKSATKIVPQPWFLDEKTCGIMLYVDFFCGNLKKLTDEIPYFKSLGINYVHLMPLFKCPKKENDGGYAISSYRMVEESLGTIEDLRLVANEFHKTGIRLVLDFVFNHTSDEHQWAIKAKESDAEFQNYYYMYDNKKEVDEWNSTLREIFPTVRRGSFTYVNSVFSIRS